MSVVSFTLNGVAYRVDTDEARRRILSTPPDTVRTHWVEIDGRRWPVKQALEVVVGVSRDEFISHAAVRLLSRMGFQTSALPVSGAPRSTAPSPGALARRVITSEEAADAFRRLDTFLQQSPLTPSVAAIEAQLDHADHSRARIVAETSGFDPQIIDAALIVRERIGTLDSLIHAAVIVQVTKDLLEPGEYLSKRPSLAAGNDPDRIFDLETNLRVAEFKVAQWKGADGLRQRGLVADLVGLTLDVTGRRRQLFVVGDRPRHFLQTSGRLVSDVLTKSAMRLRHTGLLAPDIRVRDLTARSAVEIVDLTQWFPNLA